MREDPNDILNWWRMDERVTTSGQPSVEQLRRIAALGVREVINLGLHTHEMALADEAGTVIELGMRYTHLPVDFKSPTAGDFDAFVTAFEATAPLPVHVHCIMNWRVSAFFYRYRRDILGLDPVAIRPDLYAIWSPDPVWTEFISGG